MKDSKSPFLIALKKRMKPKKAESLDLPRSIEIHDHEIPGFPGRKIGEQISVRLEGLIHAQDNGKSIVHISSVKPDSQEMTNKPEHVVRVQTQQSHA